MRFGTLTVIATKNDSPPLNVFTERTSSAFRRSMNDNRRSTAPFPGTLDAPNLGVELVETLLCEQIPAQLGVVVLALAQLDDEPRRIGNAELGHQGLPAQLSEITLS